MYSHSTAPDSPLYSHYTVIDISWLSNPVMDTVVILWHWFPPDHNNSIEPSTVQMATALKPPLNSIPQHQTHHYSVYQSTRPATVQSIIPLDPPLYTYFSSGPSTVQCTTGLGPPLYSYSTALDAPPHTHSIALDSPPHTHSLALYCHTSHVPVASTWHWEHRSPRVQVEEK